MERDGAGREGVRAWAREDRGEGGGEGGVGGGRGRGSAEQRGWKEWLGEGRGGGEQGCGE